MGGKPRHAVVKTPAVPDGAVPHLMWLGGAEARSLRLGELIDQLARRLRADGIPIDRVLSGALTAHPQVAIEGLVWTEEAGSITRLLSFDLIEADFVKGSPFAELRRGRDRIHRSLKAPAEEFEYDVYRRLQAEGMTDYYAVGLPWRGQLGHCISFASSHPGGFGDRDIAFIDALCPHIAGRLESLSLDRQLRSLLEVYLGHGAAHRVLRGDFRRGTGTEIEAGIWFCDLRGFTSLSDAADPRDVVALLDQVFERVGQSLSARGGHILKFIGDAVLAIFPHDDGDARRAVGRAVDASVEALERIDAFNAERKQQGQAAIGLGISVHHGKVYYGNLGAAERLDFTVIGPAVNEVCRLESLCKPLGRRLLLTDVVARLLDDRPLEHVGEHRFKGVTRPVDVYGLAHSARCSSE